jgi:hypothetical protein
VLFDINRNAKLGPLIASRIDTAVERLLPAAPQRFRMTVVTNADAEAAEAVVRSTPPGATAPEETAVGLAWPRELFSLSHIALPFPVTDGLYGLAPDPADAQGVALGAVAPRGETGVLVMNLDALMRVSSNPFFPFLGERIGQGIAAR